MMLHCPRCGELSEFQVRKSYQYDSETGPSEEEYAVCDHCLTAFDIADLERQAELERNDEEGKKNGTTGNN